jgi:hypothetical protein
MPLRVRTFAFVVALLAAGVAAADVSVVFSKDEISIIQRYYADSPHDAGRALLVEVATQVIHDVLLDVVLD